MKDCNYCKERAIKWSRGEQALFQLLFFVSGYASMLILTIKTKLIDLYEAHGPIITFFYIFISLFTLSVFGWSTWMCTRTREEVIKETKKRMTDD